MSEAIGAVRSLRIVFTGVDKVSNVAETISSKVRAVAGAIAILGGTGLFVTKLAEQFGFLNKEQATALERTFGLITAFGSLVTVLARLATAETAAAIATAAHNIQRAIMWALSGPVGWAILAGAAAALAAFIGFQTGLIQVPGGGGAAATTEGRGGRAVTGLARGQFGVDTEVTGPTLFLAGEAGRERVTITPEGGAGPGGLTANIHIYGIGDPEAAARAVKREIERLIERERIRRS